MVVKMDYLKEKLFYFFVLCKWHKAVFLHNKIIELVNDELIRASAWHL